jgi:hypothetical protein
VKETITVVIVTKCLLGYDVNTYAATRDSETGFTQGNGFIRPVGIFDAETLIANLAATDGPVEIVWKGFGK